MLSIIIPAYNAEATIEDTVLCILAQEYKDIEIIIIDDGSTDDTLRVVRKIMNKDQRIHVYHIENHGVSYARLKGVEYSQGEYIAFVDSDDRVTKCIYSVSVNVLDDKGADIVCFGYLRSYINGGLKEFNNTAVGIYSRDEALIQLFKGIISPSLWDKVFRRSVFKTVNTYKELLYGIKINEDYLFNFFLFSYSNIVVGIPDCLYVWMERPNSATMQEFSREHALNPVLVKKTIIEYANDNVVDYARNRYLCTLIRTYGNISRHHYTGYKKDMTIIRDEIKKSRSKIRTKLSLMDYIRMYAIIICPRVYELIYQIF